MDELESTEKVYQHRVVSVRMGFGCQDCLKWHPELNKLVSTPCKQVMMVPSLPPVEKAKAGENAIPSEIDGSVAVSTGDVATLVKGTEHELEKELEAEYAYLRLQEELLLEVALLESLQEEEERVALEAMRSHVNSTVSASSKCAPFPVGTWSMLATVTVIYILYHIGRVTLFMLDNL